MTRNIAQQIVATYDANVKVNGLEWTEKHFLAKGTKRYEKNLDLLLRAQKTIRKTDSAKVKS